ncbi:hypothetical protein FEDK69T_24950 [Flavobacterium enshiense DK69]|nr:hypothetical protein FEDK69T_24950 [Flavobacterium enshiense DK69]
MKIKVETFRFITITSIITTISVTALCLIGIAIYFSFHHKNAERLMKIFRVATSVSMILIITIAALSLIGITITGLYPGIITLLLVTLIPIASKFYEKKISIKSNAFQIRYYIMLTIINLLSILLVLFMTFVIVHDRVFQDCC